MPAYRAMGFEKVGQSIFIATSAYESVKAGYALSLAKTVQELTRRNIPHSINLMFGNCHVDDARNDLVKDFLDNTECTDLVFIDADMMWEPREFLKLIKHDTPDIVAGAYTFKSNSGTFPVGKILGGDEGVYNSKEALLSVSYAPTGFMRIPRGVFDALATPATRKLNPSRRFFERRYTENTYDGGDVTFCRKWIATGGRVLIDPSLTLTHIGEQRWTGTFSNYLTKPENVALHTVDSKDPVPTYKPDLPDAMADIAAKSEPELSDFIALSEAYGNKKWAAAPEFLWTAYNMAMALPEDATILECGSGISTAVLALSGRKVISLEEHQEWADKTDAMLKSCGLDAEIFVSPIGADGWYEGRKSMAGLNAEMLVIDGPRRRKGINRLWPMGAMALDMGAISHTAAVLIDDDAKVDCSYGEFVACGTALRPAFAGRLSYKQHLKAAE